MVDTGPLTFYTGCQAYFSATCTCKFDLKGNDACFPIGGTFYLDNGKLNFAYSTGTIASDIINLRVADEFLYGDEKFVSFGIARAIPTHGSDPNNIYLKYSGDNVFWITANTDFGTQINYAIRCDIENNWQNKSLERPFAFHILDWACVCQGNGSLNITKEIGSSSFYSGLDISAPPISVRVNVQNGVFKENPKDALKINNARLKEKQGQVEKITQHPGNMSYVRNFFKNTKFSVTTWGGAGGIKSDYEQEQGNGNREQLYNLPLNVGEFASGLSFGAYAIMPTNISTIVDVEKDKEDGFERIGTNESPDEMYVKAVIKGGKYYMVPETMTAKDVVFKGDFVWVKGGIKETTNG